MMTCYIFFDNISPFFQFQGFLIYIYLFSYKNPIPFKIKTQKVEKHINW